MRVVLDTNILASALMGGSLKIIVDKWKAGVFKIIVSHNIVREYFDVIQRPKLKITSDEIATVNEYLLKAAEFVTPIESVHAVEADPSDNKFLEAALEGKAIYVVSGDNHLLELKSFRGIEILTAREFIARLK